MRNFPLLLLLCLLAGPALAAPTKPTATVRKHLLYFRDKASTPYSVAQPQAFLTARALQRRARQHIAVLPRDLPVDPAYVARVQAVPGAQVWYTSRWFNAVVVSCDSATLAVVQTLPFVQGARTLNRSAAGAAGPLPTPAALARRAGRADYGLAYTQAQLLGAVQMHEAGFRGEGMQIAVFDAGFPGVNTLPALAPLYQQNRLGSVYNFVDRSASVYERSSHGTNVLSTMAANQPGFFIGTAPQATYHLFITEDVSSEHPVEEVNWLIAAERADSLGVDIINSSLGYTTFDRPSVDYTYADMNGRTALSTRAATVAARVGMLVVCSAGNEGNNSWRYITAPADADSILTVGAVDSLQRRAGFSSVGPTADGRLKPNVSAMGVQAAVLTAEGAAVRGDGTSFASPITAGLAAGFWQSSRTLTAQQVLDYLQRSSSHATQPDNLTGYGVPHFGRAYNLANPATPLATAPGGQAAEQLVLYPTPTSGDEVYLQLPSRLRAKALTVRLYDARGALVTVLAVPATTAPEVRLTPGPLAKGLYNCSVQAGPVRYTVRLVKR